MWILTLHWTTNLTEWKLQFHFTTPLHSISLYTPLWFNLKTSQKNLELRMRISHSDSGCRDADQGISFDLQDNENIFCSEIETTILLDFHDAGLELISFNKSWYHVNNWAGKCTLFSQVYQTAISSSIYGLCSEAKV